MRRCCKYQLAIISTASIFFGGCSATSSMQSWFYDEPAPVSQAEPETQHQVEGYAHMPESLRPQYRPDSRDRQMAANPGDANNIDTVSSSMSKDRNRIRSLFEAAQTHKSLKDYAAQLTMQLMDRAVMLAPQDLIGVTSFVNFDETLTTTNPLGTQLAEYFIGEVQHYGLGIVDFKVSQAISVSSSGDLVFSRDAAKLANKMAMDYVLTGTLMYRSQGVSVNARIIDLESRRVVSTANVLIPDFVVAQLDPYLTSL